MKRREFFQRITAFVALVPFVKSGERTSKWFPIVPDGAGHPISANDWTYGPATLAGKPIPDSYGWWRLAGKSGQGFEWEFSRTKPFLGASEGNRYRA